MSLLPPLMLMLSMMDKCISGAYFLFFRTTYTKLASYVVCVGSCCSTFSGFQALTFLLLLCASRLLHDSKLAYTFRLLSSFGQIIESRSK
jgi:hypothetical protein